MKFDDFQKYLAELRALPPEVPLEPELKPHRLKLDKRIREEQALAAGAVLTAVLEPGEGGASPQEGDLLYIHYSIRSSDDELLYSTRSEEGGSGQAFAFLMEKGPRVPRGWELALRDMTRGQRNVLQLAPQFGFCHPDCRLRPPVRNLPKDATLRFEITLLHWYPAASVHSYGPGELLLKRSVREASAWESPRAPCEVTLHLTVCCPAYDGIPLSGQRLFTTRGRNPLSAQLGRGLLPQAVEEALSYMSRNEVAVFVVPASAMRPGAGAGGGWVGGARGWEQEEEEDGSSSGEEGDLLGGPSGGASGRRKAAGAAAGPSGGGGGEGGGSRCLLPAPPPRCVQLEVEMELVAMVQVRDMTGTGEVTKKRLREGTGEFPIDCPLRDTSIQLHYKVRQLAVQGTMAVVDGGAASDEEEVWAYDSRSQGPDPISADTGCEELPEGLEMAIKLMVPGEVARVVAAPRFAYGGGGGGGGSGGGGGGGRSDCPPGVDPGAAVEWEVELVDFEREGHWQNLSFEERYALTERLKAKANELYRKQQYKFARARYEGLFRLLESTRDYEDEEQVERITGYKVAVLGNSALAAMGQGEHVAAVAACDKALQFDPENAKLHFRKGKALSLNGDHEAAAEALKLALEYDPSSEKDINAEIFANAERQKAALRKQKRDLANFLKPNRR